MKQIYCFLILIIFVCILYDNTLIEGNDHVYDTKKDATIAYKTKRKTEESIFDQLGLSNLIPKEYSKGITITSYTTKLKCERFKNKKCNEGIGSHMTGSKWEYGNKTPSKTNKKNCMDCFKCRDNYAFTDEFYSYMCDTIAGCYKNTDNYVNDTLPYAYAYDNTKFDKACAGKNINPLQALTCGALKDNAIVDTFLLTKKPATMACNAEIATLNSPVGSVAKLIL